MTPCPHPHVGDAEGLTKELAQARSASPLLGLAWTPSVLPIIVRVMVPTYLITRQDPHLDSVRTISI